MWPIPVVEHEIVTVSFSSDSLVCSWIQKTNNGLAPLVLRAYERYLFDNLELEHLTIFNPTTIKKHITSFLHKHDKQNAFIVFSLDGSGVTEQFVALPTSTPHRADFGVTYSSNVLWGHRYVYPNDHGQSVFYVYSVPRSLLLQYQLLAVAAECNVITITTKNMGLLTVYKHIFGAAFRRSQLAIDMMRHNNNIDDLISVDILKRIITVPLSVQLNDERSYIAAACGLFFDEKEIE
jgi:hypothetical protein